MHIVFLWDTWWFAASVVWLAAIELHTSHLHHPKIHQGTDGTSQILGLKASARLNELAVRTGKKGAGQQIWNHLSQGIRQILLKLFFPRHLVHWKHIIKNVWPLFSTKPWNFHEVYISPLVYANPSSSSFLLSLSSVQQPRLWKQSCWPVGRAEGIAQTKNSPTQT